MACSNAIEVLRCSPDKLITLNWFQNSALWEELHNRIQLYSTSRRHNYCSRVKTSSTWSNSQWQMRKNAKSTKIRNHSEGFAFLSASFYAPNRIPHVSKVTDDQLVNSKMLFLQPLIGIQDIKYSNRLTQKTVLRRARQSLLGGTLLTARCYPE